MKKKSISYPSKTLFEAKDFVLSVYEAVGDQTPLMYDKLCEYGKVPIRETAYMASTAAQYGWSESIYGKGHVVNGEICKILRKPQDGEESAILLKAFTSPEVYKKIIQDWNNKQIQSEKALDIYLSRNFGFTDKGAALCSKVFIENAKSLGLIDSDNNFKVDAEIVISEPKEKKTKVKEVKDVKTKSTSSVNEKKKQSDTSKHYETPPTPPSNNGGNKTVMVFIKGKEFNWPVPNDMTQTDWDHVVKQIQNIKTWAK